MSLITEALQLRSPKKPRAIQIEALPPFSSRRVNFKVFLWVGGLALAIVLGVWQGPAVWKFLEQATGMHGLTAAQSVAQAPVRPEPPVTLEPAAAPDEKVTKPTAPEVKNSDQGPSGLLEKAATPVEAIPQPVVIPFQMADLEDVAAAAEKLKQKRELLVRNLQIQGVRMQGRDSRALIDGNPVGLGEPVGGEGIRLKAVEPSRLIFEDSDNEQYIKSY